MEVFFWAFKRELWVKQIFEDPIERGGGRGSWVRIPRATPYPRPKINPF